MNVTQRIGSLAGLTLLLMTGATAAQETNRQDRAVRRLMDAAGIPGLAIATVASGRLAWSAAYGVKDSKTNETVDEHTVFEAASLSKPVVAYAALRMVARGELDLDQPLWTTLPYDRLEHDERAKAITPRHVLTHTTGLPNWGDTPLEMLRGPNERWGYSGEGFVYLQRALEVVTGRPLDDIVRHEVFEPLGMTRSSFVWQSAYDSTAATPHDLLGEPTQKRKPDEENAAASLHTTAEDYARFLAAMVSGGGLPDHLARAVRTPSVQVASRNEAEAPSTVHWALGWGIQRGRRGDAIWHWGDNGNFRCFVIGYPGDTSGLVYFTNSNSGLAIAEDLVGLFFDDTHEAIRWLDYQRYDDPQRTTRIRLRRAFLTGGTMGGMQAYRAAQQSAPETINAEELNDLGSFLLGRDRTEDALAVFQVNVDEHPTVTAWIGLAEGTTAAGQHQRALDAYRQALSLDPTRREDAEPRIQWLEDGLEAAAHPVTLADHELDEYAGTYGPRRITVRDDGLYYSRQGSTAETRLVPLSRDLFALESNHTFRIRFERDESGRPDTIVGLYSDGRRDETGREGGRAGGR